MTVRRIPFPREHGAWAVLFAALVLALAHPWVRSWPAVVLALLFVLAFAIQAPLRSVAAGRPGAWAWVAGYGIVLLAGASYLVVAYGLYLLLPAAGFGLLLTAADLLARRHKKQRSVALRLAGISALTLVLPGMVCVFHPDRTTYAFVLWGLMLTYFAARFPVVRARLAARRGEPFSSAHVWAAQVLPYLVAGGFVAGGAASTWVLLALLPATVFTFAPPEGSLKRAGWIEVGLLVWFIAVVVASYHIAS